MEMHSAAYMDKSWVLQLECEGEMDAMNVLAWS